MNILQETALNLNEKKTLKFWKWPLIHLQSNFTNNHKKIDAICQHTTESSQHNQFKENKRHIKI